MIRDFIAYVKAYNKMKKGEIAQADSKMEKLAQVELIRGVRQSIQAAGEQVKKSGLKWENVLDPETEALVAEMHAAIRKELPAVPAPARESLTREQALSKLRRHIISEIINKKEDVVTLVSFTPEETEKLFPVEYGNGWREGEVCLPVKMFVPHIRLYKTLGGVRTIKAVLLTPQKLHEHMKTLGRTEIYGHIRTTEDWNEINNANVKQVVAAHVAEKQSKKKAVRPAAPVNAAERPDRKPAPAPAAPVTGRADAIRTIRSKVISDLRRFNTFEVKFGTLLWGDASACFPDGPHSTGWEAATLILNAKTKELYADLDTYPNQFGASYQSRKMLSPAEFRDKAVKHFKLSGAIEKMQTQADWDAVFDAEVAKAVAEVEAYQQEKKRKRHEADRLRYAIVISDELRAQKPRMDYTQVMLKLAQRYGTSEIIVVQKDGKYHIAEERWSHLGRMPEPGQTHIMTDAEAVWFEKRLEEAISSGDQTTFQSLPGGDLMTVVIKKAGEICVDQKDAKPLKKYVSLQLTLGQLISYGSLTEKETDRKPD